eukprot:Tbor_TRINITY_DN5129_c0_g1::TRINITY_DN5129_c0_g1_i1::g.26249::m.26249
MYIHSKCALGPKSIAQMLNKLKLAGAHPDVVFAIDPEKAAANGNELIRLETLLANRELNQSSTQTYQSLQGSHKFKFWMKPFSVTSPLSTINALIPITCSLTPNASDEIFKRQLKELFIQAHIRDDFQVSANAIDDIGESSINNLLHKASQRHIHHHTSTSPLFIRGDRAIDAMRQFGTLIVVNERDTSFLVTMPEEEGVPSAYQRSEKGNSGGILDVRGELTPEAQLFMNERGMRPFELRMAGSQSAVEQFVLCFERLENLYHLYRGKALRGCVCIVIDLETLKDGSRAPPKECNVSFDGCLVLPLSQFNEWESFLLSRTQPTWRMLVESHKQWRLHPALELHHHRRKLAKLADIFGFFSVTMETKIGSSDRLWQEDLISRLQKEEPVIRKTIEKYDIRHPLAKKRGQIFFVKGLRSATTGESIQYKITAVGHIFFNAGVSNGAEEEIISAPQILKVLRGNIKHLMDKSIEYDRVLSRLSRLGETLRVEFSIDENFKSKRDLTMLDDLSYFAKTIEGSLNELKQLRDRNQPRMTWVIGEHMHVMPSGIIYIPYNVSMESLKKHMLAR